MKLLIGTDEAGYGPNLGPLVVCATAWPLASGSSDELFTEFDQLFCRPEDDSDDRLKVGDSKQIYKSGDGLAGLEKSVLPICLAFQKDDSRNSKLTLKNLRQILQVAQSNIDLPWYKGFDPTLPIDYDPDQLVGLIQTLRSGYGTPHHHDSTSASLPAQISSVIEPKEFNEGCIQFGNKASLLSDTTLDLVKRLILTYQAADSKNEIGSVSVICDKHGGRSHYAGMLQNTFSESWVGVVSESRESSHYELTWNDWPIRFQFIAKGESHLPVAFASMIAKYLREVCMIGFNRFWLNKMPNLKPTAGYPVDAKRFRRTIEADVRKLGLNESTWWRLK